jgi:hypothetical protein
VVEEDTVTELDDEEEEVALIEGVGNMASAVVPKNNLLYACKHATLLIVFD